MLSFLGMELPKVTVDRDYNINKPETKVVKKILEQIQGKQQTKNQVRDDKVAYKDCARQRGMRCAYSDCGQHAEDGEKFMACSRCKESKLRVTLYCSK